MTRTYLVTGGAKGLGLDIVRSILSESDTAVYVVSRSSSHAFDKLVADHPNRVFFKSYDLANVNDVRSEIFKNFLTNRVKIDGFVNNAAVAYDDIITNMRAEPLEQMYKVNVFSPMMITKGVIRNMLLHKTQGSIVHISSISVHTGYKGLSMYASTKGALEAFSKNTAREWGALKIRSNALVAGFMETTMSSTLQDSQKKRIYARTSLKVATETSSVADTTAFLLSDKAKSISGQNIHVDSGTI